MTITGTNTNFVDGTTTLASSSADLIIDSFTVDDVAQEIDAQFSLDFAAPTHTATITVTTGAEMVTGDFDIQEFVITCDDFTISPDALTIGRFDTDIYLTRPTPGWIPGVTEAYIVGSPSHLRLGDVGDTPVERCTVNSSTYAICDLTSGVLAVPGDYEILMVTGSETLCGLITIEPDAVGTVSLPSADLPAHYTYTGSLDAAGGNRSDFYAFSPLAGETWVFHVFSLDRATLDPVLRLIDAGGDDWLVYKNDETALGIDSRIVYHFAAPSTNDYYIEVGPFLTWDIGSYELYVHRLTHGGVVNEGVAANDDFASAEVLSSIDSTMLYGSISDAADVDVFEIDTTGLGPVAIDIAARRLGPWETSTADVEIEVYDTSDTSTWLYWNNTWYYESPPTADPRVFLDTEGSYYVKVISEASSTGFYGINLRPLVVINEVDNRTTTSNPFVELVGPSNFDLTDYQLCAYDGTGGPVDTTAECVSLDGLLTSGNGYVAVWGNIFTETTLVLPPGAGAVVLTYGATVIDAVQYGTLTSGSFAEGNPAEVGHSRTIGRGAEVDTNNNDIDFIYMASPTPGQPNDRTCQAAVPLYGETPG